VAGGLVARRRALPWATLATTSAGVVDPFAALPQVKRWYRDLIADLEREAELAPADHAEVSPHLVIAFTTTALVGRHDFPPHYRFVGPSLGARPEPDDFPFGDLRRPCVLVSMGTVNAEASGRFYTTAIAALADAPTQVILVAPPSLAPPPLPANVIARPRVPQLALLPHLDAVICHGGHNTTCEALAHGLPLVVAPIKDDQPIVAEQVVAAGAGLRVKFGRVQADELRDVTVRVLSEPRFRAAAAQIAATFARAGGAPAAARALVELANR
jgi:MGT family glycosyltransferase